MPKTYDTEASLLAEYEAWLKSERLPDELPRDLLEAPGDLLSDAQRDWLADWYERYQKTVVYERGR